MPKASSATVVAKKRPAVSRLPSRGSTRTTNGHATPLILPLASSAADPAREEGLQDVHESPDDGEEECLRTRFSPYNLRAVPSKAPTTRSHIAGRDARSAVPGATTRPTPATSRRKRSAKTTAKLLNSIPLPSSRRRPTPTLWAFGAGGNGQLGLGTKHLDEFAKPVRQIWVEGCREGRKLGASDGAGFEKIAVGGMHTLAIDELGRVWTWGVNDDAALGRSTAPKGDPEDARRIVETDELESEPHVLQALADSGFRAVEVAGGSCTGAALGQDGTIRAWGLFKGKAGALGFHPPVIPGAESTRKPQKDPIYPPLLDPSSITSISPFPIFTQIVAGHDHLLFLTSKGEVYAWGDGQQGQLGRRWVEQYQYHGLRPTKIPHLRNIIHIATGAYHSFAIEKSGDVYGWGLNNYGQLGVGWRGGHTGGRAKKKFPQSGNEDDANQVIWAPMKIESLCSGALSGDRKVVYVDGGEHHTLFLLNDGSLWSCGGGGSSQLGIGEGHPAWETLLKDPKRNQDAIEGATPNRGGKDAGDSKMANGQVDSNTHAAKCSQENTQLHIHAYIPFPVPVLLPPPPTIAESSSNGGQYVDHPIEPITEAAPLTPVGQRIVSMSTAMRFNLALTEEGHCYSWGLGESSELGRGRAITESRTPGRVVLSTKKLEHGQEVNWRVESVYAGGQHCFAVAKHVVAVAKHVVAVS